MRNYTSRQQNTAASACYGAMWSDCKVNGGEVCRVTVMTTTVLSGETVMSTAVLCGETVMSTAALCGETVMSIRRCCVVRL